MYHYLSYRFKITLMLILTSFTLMSSQELQPLEVKGGVAFVEFGQYVLTNARWTLAFDVPYAQLYNGVRILLENIKVVTNAPVVKYIDISVINYIKFNLKFLYNTTNCLLVEMEEYIAIHITGQQREKRGLINIGGRILNFLFGTAEDEQIGVLNDKIERERERQDRMFNLLADQATYLNSTMVALADTQKAVASLATIISHIQTRTDGTRSELLRTQMTHHLELIHAELSREWGLMKEAINDLAQGKLSSYFIHPHEMIAILRRIGSRLPPGVSLLTPISPQLAHTIYSWVTVIPTLWQSTIRVFVRILLRTPHNSFELYRILMLPEKVPETNLSIILKPETPFLAVTPDRQYHMLISALDFLKCTIGPIKICEWQEVVQTKSCAIAIFTKNEEKIRQLCARYIVPDPKPIAYRINQAGRWIYSVPHKIRLSSTCTESRLNHLFELEGHGIINLPDTCTGYGPDFVLPPHFQGETEYTLNLSTRLVVLEKFETLSMEEQLETKQIERTSEEDHRILERTQLLGEISAIPLHEFREHFRNRDVHWTSGLSTGINWTSLVMLLVVMIIVFWIVCRKRTPIRKYITRCCARGEIVISGPIKDIKEFDVSRTPEECAPSTSRPGQVTPYAESPVIGKLRRTSPAYVDMTVIQHKYANPSGDSVTMEEPTTSEGYAVPKSHPRNWETEESMHEIL